ncbi:GIY-YIG nuclease family protein [Hymenobacter nivis]|uniref:GIY-YIG domain-containing protein n=1 Tax=Hymenobacter nivis TaxID=1850093 RepID=A0A2Z3GEJ5_9BACT|nr:GIY-YIG nuclease family protein [Hymenobacter nivis]AWM32109.1 hypothetical protein DDQ68_04440 [Hymenobacter nivis]
MLSEWLLERGFSLRHDVAGRPSIAALFAGSATCGIHILHFANEEYYVGLAKNVVRRYVQHRRTHTDIVSLSFKPVEDALLKRVESAEIAFFKSRVRLRNIDEMEDLIMERDVDKLVVPEVAARFLREVTYNDLSGEKYLNEELQANYRYRQCFQQLTQQPFYVALLAACKQYVHAGVPAPVKTEYAFWSVTCFPLKPHKEDTIVLRLNIYQQEVFTVFRTTLANGKKSLEYWFQLAKTPLMELNNGISGMAMIRQQCSSARFDDHFYRTGGNDQLRLGVSAADFTRLVRLPAFRKAVRLHNLRLMRKGTNMNRVSHCMDFAEELLKPA